MATIEQELAGLAAEAPEGLADKVFTGWLTAPSRLGEVHVAFTPDGVQFVRGDATTDEFSAAYRDRFDRPLRHAARGPAGLAEALREPARAPSLDLGALRPFERAVLEATRRIPAGEVRPYAWVAREAGSPAAVRAVGTALARNPVPLLVPCHRVVRSDGAPGQYMYGTDRKRALLAGEGLDVDVLVGTPFVGDDSTGVVCYPSCRHARAATGTDRRPFRRVQDALARGYRSCPDCRPAVSDQ